MAQDLSKRGKVGNVYRSGSYKKAAKKGYKTTGLTRKQMSKVTTLKGKALTKKQKTRASELKSISDTKWVKGKGVVGKNGKAFTGTVQLASGKTASYVKGRRVGVNTKKKTTKTQTGPYKPPVSTTRVTPQQRQENAGPRTTGTGATAAKISSDNLRSLGRARSIARRGGRQAARQASTIQSTGRPMSTPSYTTGQGRGGTTLKRGARKTERRGAFLITYEWDGTRWTQARKQRVSG